MAAGRYVGIDRDRTKVRVNLGRKGFDLQVDRIVLARFKALVSEIGLGLDETLRQIFSKKSRRQHPDHALGIWIRQHEATPPSGGEQQ